MKKIFFILFTLLLSISFADSIKDVGIAKYAVLEVLKDKTPIREQNNENAKRITHVLKDTVVFADKETNDYYRVEFDENKYGWINKKDIEVQAIIPEKRFDEISKVNFREDKKNYFIDIETPFKSSWIFNENENGLNFTLFDNKFSPLKTNITNKRGAFFINPLEDNKFNFIFKSNHLFGYNIEAIDKGYTLNIRKSPKISKRRPLRKIRVVVDAGHGGKQYGACAFGLKEKDINLEIAKKLAHELRKRGARVYLTRKHDKCMDLYERVDFAAKKEADILISIHQNSLPNPKDIEKKHGVGVYYYNNQSKPLAQYLQNNLLTATEFKDDGVNYASFALTRPTNQISVLVECGYLIYKPEADKLVNKDFQKRIAKAIVKGCEEYLLNTFNPKIL